MPELFYSCSALVLREVRYKEADKILTLYSPERGRFTAKAVSAYRKNSRVAAATQQLTYSDMSFVDAKGGLVVKEASIKESFSGLRTDFSAYALGCYFAECIESLTVENVPDPALSQLVLNSLYALSGGMRSPELIKAAFELRLISVLGYRPDLSSCMVCEKPEPVEPVLGIQTGRICCRTCRNADVGITDYLSDTALRAMRHIVSAPSRSFLPAELSDEGETKKLSAACEDYFLEHSGRRYATLDYWKKLK